MKITSQGKESKTVNALMCIQRKIFVMDWKIPPSSLKQNAIPAPRGFAPRVWNLHFAFVIRVEFFNPSLKFSLDSLISIFYSYEHSENHSLNIYVFIKYIGEGICVIYFVYTIICLMLINLLLFFRYRRLKDSSTGIY